MERHLNLQDKRNSIYVDNLILMYIPQCCIENYFLNLKADRNGIMLSINFHQISIYEF